ncbi:MAG: hypothetical protein ACPLW9_02200 [Minisyncoccales bacterium]
MLSVITSFLNQELFPFLVHFLNILWQLLKNWWWLVMPFLLWEPLLYLYHYYINERWDKTIKRILLEVKIPKEIVKPIRAMDQVFAGFHAIHDIPTWREKWIEGVFQLSLAFEIVSLEGKIHFFIRTPEIFRQVIESNIYSQYPEAEISVVDDYTKRVPQNIPNREWDLWGVEFINAKDEIYPLKTYRQFEIESEKEEQKKVDPLSDFLEGLSALGPGEQMWLQIIARPVLGRDYPWQEKGRALADKLARRPEKKKPKPALVRFIDSFLTAIADGIQSLFNPEALKRKEAGPSKKEEELIPPEMKLTPGEREVVKAIEEKLAKFGYLCCVRFVYLGKKEVFLKPKVKVVFSFFKELSTENLGGLKPWSKTMTKIKSPVFWFLDDRRLYLRKRRMFRYYTKRWFPLFPRGGKTYILNTEELATLYHFPGATAVPAMGVSRVETKKKGVPTNLPTEV